MAAIKGSFRELDALRRKIGEISGPAFRIPLSKRLGAAGIKLLADEFARTTDPYGEAWKPLQFKRRRGARGAAKVLSDTGRLKASFARYGVRPNDSGFALGTDVEYAAPHQYGARVAPHSRIPKAGAEQIFHPRTGRFLSASQAKRFRLVYVRAVPRRTYAKGITIPRRQMMPEPEQGLGAAWGNAFNREADAFMRAYLKTS